MKKGERASGESPVILSASLARRMFGNETPWGSNLNWMANGHWCPIVGVAADTKNNGLTDPSDPEYYRLRMKGSDQIGAKWGCAFSDFTRPGDAGAVDSKRVCGA